MRLYTKEDDIYINIPSNMINNIDEDNILLKEYIRIYKNVEKLKEYIIKYLFEKDSSITQKNIGDLLLNINYLPVLNPDIVTGVSLMTLFVFLNVNFGMTTMLLSHLVFDIPYVILSVLPKLKQLPANIEDAALDLGATPWYALRKIVLPQIKPGIISGALMAFTMSIDDFVISFFTTGNGVTNLSIEIYSMTRRGLTPEINALSTLMFVVVLALLITSNVVGNKKAVEN